MNDFCLTAVMIPASKQPPAGDSAVAVLIERDRLPVELSLADNGVVAAKVPTGHRGRPPHRERARRSSKRSGRGPIALIVSPTDAGKTDTGKSSWYLVPLSDELAVNGVAPLLSICRIEPGSLIAYRDWCWFAAQRLAPTPVEAPADMAEKTCPVCDGELKLAPVVQCTCGRWTHLERPDVPEDPEALNCFLSARQCGLCHKPASLKPVLVPEPSARLLPPLSSEDTWYR